MQAVHSACMLSKRNVLGCRQCIVLVCCLKGMSWDAGSV